MSRESDELGNAKSIEQRKKGSSRRRRIRVIVMKVEVTGDDEFRGGGDEVFEKDSKFSLENSLEVGAGGR